MRAARPSGGQSGESSATAVVVHGVPARRRVALAVPAKVERDHAPVLGEVLELRGHAAVVAGDAMHQQQPRLTGA